MNFGKWRIKWIILWDRAPGASKVNFKNQILHNLVISPSNPFRGGGSALYPLITLCLKEHVLTKHMNLCSGYRLLLLQGLNTRFCMGNRHTQIKLLEKLYPLWKSEKL